MKKTLTKEALALLNGKAEDENSTKFTDAELAEQEAVAKAAAEEVATKAAAEEDDDTDDSDGEPTLQEEFDAFKAENASLVEDLSSQIEELKTSAEEAIASFAEQTERLKSIISGHVSQMRIAVGLADVDMTDLTVDRLLTEYDSSMAAFEKLPIGGVVPVPEGKAEETQTSSIDLAAADATGLN